MSLRKEETRRREALRGIIAIFIDNPTWPDSRVAKETGFDTAEITEIRQWALSYPPVEGVAAAPPERK